MGQNLGGRVWKSFIFWREQVHGEIVVDVAGEKHVVFQQREPKETPEPTHTLHKNRRESVRMYAVVEQDIHNREM